MVIIMKKRNKIAIDLFTKNIENELLNQKKAKEVLKEKKLNLKSSTNYLNYFDAISVPLLRLSLIDILFIYHEENQLQINLQHQLRSTIFKIFLTFTFYYFILINATLPLSI